MKKQFDNLRPFEKRVVVGVAIAVFALLNLWFVFPHFSDWGNVQNRMDAARAKLTKYQLEIDKKGVYEAGIAKLAESGNLDVPAEDQQNQFSRAVQIQQAQSGVSITSTSKQQVRTNNPFFLELSENVGITSGEKQLVDFLYNLGAGPSLIRVRDMSLHPDGPRFQLSANVKLVASYQKAAPKAAARTSPPPQPATSKRS